MDTAKESSPDDNTKEQAYKVQLDNIELEVQKCEKDFYKIALDCKVGNETTTINSNLGLKLANENQSIKFEETFDK